MRTVHKFPMAVVDGPQDIVTHGVPKVVHVGMQADQVTLWAEVDTSQEKVSTAFLVTGTGEEIPLDFRHQGTIQHRGFVWHIYQDRHSYHPSVRRAS